MKIALYVRVSSRDEGQYPFMPIFLFAGLG